MDKEYLVLMDNHENPQFNGIIADFDSKDAADRYAEGYIKGSDPKCCEFRVFKKFSKEHLEYIYNKAIKWAHIRKSGKSKACILVLELMDSEEYENNYCASLDCVLANYPDVDKVQLEKELDKYI